MPSAQIISEVETAKANIAELNVTISESKLKQKDALAECKRVEKEMEEFKTNRGSKLAQIKAEIASKKAEVGKHTASVKTLQREVQTSELELGESHSLVLVDLDGPS